ncbi:zinc-binding dehydrogenase [Pontibacillus halophilus]|uniref:zinc-binding dehydrogenase n=1 Tax=Pontibacillus halophilus TaxID=516704 RepID=UPI0004152D32|nr:zinc-binding dehydrogenase [Pontibacillus halophilus]
MRAQGTLAPYTITKAHTVSKIPEEISFVDAAALPCAGYTAYEALYKKMKIVPDRTILIHGGSGGVGGFAIQLAKHVGLQVITTASKENHDFVRSLGADEVIDYKQGMVNDHVLSWTNGRGVDYILDTVSSQNATDSMSVLSYHGEIVTIPGRVDLNSVAPFTIAPSVHEVALGAIHAYGSKEDQKSLRRMGSVMLELVRDGKLDPMVERVISLEEAAQGMKDMKENRFRGKLVVSIEEE